ncbi:MAG: DNA internalization-related competence protein ComEC/Rec2, partial [Thioalkalispiraceae bacterium]
MRSGTIAFLAGIIALQQCSVLPPVYVGLSLLPLAMLAYLGKRRGLWLVFFCMLGFCWALWHAQSRLQQQLPPPLIARDVQVIGQVTGLPEQRQRSTRFEFNVEQLSFNEQIFTSPGHIKLSWYGASAPEIKPGERWQLQVRLKPPHGFMNPGGFDYEKWLFQKGLRATGYVRKSAVNQRLEAANPLDIHGLRLTIRQHLDRLLANEANAALIKALAIGDRSSMSPRQWQLLRDTGTAHLMAISGLHVGLVAAMAFWLGRWAWSFAGPARLRVPAQKIGAVSAALVAVLYALLAGWSIPTQRALVMVLVVMSGIVFYRHYASSRVLAIALLAVLLYDPLSVLAAGFWLSFIAVAVIAFAMQGRRNALNRLQQWGYLQGSISLGLVPVMLILFGQVSLVSPLANLWAIPLVSVLVVPLTLLSVIALYFSQPLASGLLWLALQLLDGIEWLLALMAQWPWAIWQSASPPPGLVLLAMAGVFMLLLPRGWPHRWLGLVLLAPAMLMPLQRPATGEADFTLLDVGQGLASVIQTRRHVLVFDTGPRYSERFDTGQRVVLPFLRQQGIDGIDVLVISHADNDHRGGAGSLLDNSRVERIISSVPGHFPVDRVQTCQAGQSWRWDGVLFEFLHPDASYYPGNLSAGRSNNRSCVLRVTTGKHSVLIPADIEREVEARLVDQYGRQLESTVLVVPHHGSQTSSSPRFLDQVRPQLALLAVGYLNRYQHPHHGVMARYAQRRIAVKSTAMHG